MLNVAIENQNGWNYSAFAPYKTGAGIGLLFIVLVSEHAPKACFLLPVALFSMVAQAGASHEAPGSDTTGKTNPVWATTNQIGLCCGSDNVIVSEAAIMVTQLIPVFNGTISNETTLLCNARDLHAFLEVGKRFATWITERISEYQFIENQDFLIISQNREKISRGRPAKDYLLTLDTAKELAMVERNEKGRQIRRYFIECEKKLRDATPDRNKIIHGSPRTVVIRLDDAGNIIYTETVPDNAYVCTLDAFRFYLEQQGWTLVNRNAIKNMTVEQLLCIK
ncbi:transcriptional regulator [Salmonella enterica]|nr:transcriptional regulator [Salmonella enterica]EDH4007919.1 transcriptional regulator [Salmonella enterica subsp. enterica serovar Kottbus]EEL6457186.1 transcriptional regulator [Salmonella enterica subsp. enterica serovar Kottbus]